MPRSKGMLFVLYLGLIHTLLAMYKAKKLRAASDQTISNGVDSEF